MLMWTPAGSLMWIIAQKQYTLLLSTFNAPLQSGWRQGRICRAITCKAVRSWLYPGSVSVIFLYYFYSLPFHNNYVMYACVGLSVVEHASVCPIGVCSCKFISMFFCMLRSAMGAMLGHNRINISQVNNIKTFLCVINLPQSMVNECIVKWVVNLTLLPQSIVQYICSKRIIIIIRIGFFLVDQHILL